MSKQIERSPPKAISPLHKSQHLSNLSLTNYSWDKTLFEGLQSRKLNTEEDQALYSYSKFSASNPNSEVKRGKESNYHIPGNYQTLDDGYNPIKDYPPLLSTQPKTLSTSENSKQKSQQEDVQGTLQELSRRISQDQITIQRLQDVIQDKDKIIMKHQQFQQYLTSHRETKAPSFREDSQSARQNSAPQVKQLQKQIQDLENTIRVSEDKLKGFNRQLTAMEKENCKVKAEKLLLEQKYYQVLQVQNHVDKANEQLKQELDRERQLTKTLNESILRLQLQVSDQQSIIAQQSDQLLQQQKRILGPRDKKQVTDPGLVKVYRSGVHDPQHLHSRTSCQSSDYDIAHSQKFIDCIVDMVQNCQPSQSRPRYRVTFIQSLKRCWKLLKQILEDYMELKKADSHRQFMKASQGFSMQSSDKEGEKKSHGSRDNSKSFKT